MAFTAAMGIPIMAGNVERLRRHYFSQPCALPLPCVVQVKTGAILQPGLLSCVSPVEIRMAVLKAVADDLDNTERVQAWKRHLLSCHFVYVILDSDEDRWNYARQLREDISQQYATLRLSALQRVFEVVHFLNTWGQLHGAQSVATAAEAYKAGVRMGTTSESLVTLSFVDSAMTDQQTYVACPAHCSHAAAS